MSRSAPKPSDHETQAARPARGGKGGDEAAHRITSPARLVKKELELRDGRYLLAYANGTTNPTDA